MFMEIGRGWTHLEFLTGIGCCLQLSFSQKKSIQEEIQITTQNKKNL